MLSLYLSTLLNSFISTRGLGTIYLFACSVVFSLSPSTQLIMSRASRSSFISFFLVYMTFISFSCLITLPRSMLNSSSESDYSCLIPDHRGKTFRLSPLCMVSAVGFLYMFFLKLRKFSESFFMNEC